MNLGTKSLCLGRVSSQVVGTPPISYPLMPEQLSEPVYSHGNSKETHMFNACIELSTHSLLIAFAPFAVL